uniref:Uncharacterized protein n=1 Tax=Octopus bimaculoides TaxID=37653 RepID=A0A0L8HUU1_OCTBM
MEVLKGTKLVKQKYIQVCCEWLPYVVVDFLKSGVLFFPYILELSGKEMD